MVCMSRPRRSLEAPVSPMTARQLRCMHQPYIEALQRAIGPYPRISRSMTDILQDVAERQHEKSTDFTGQSPGFFSDRALASPSTDLDLDSANLRSSSRDTYALPVASRGAMIYANAEVSATSSPKTAASHWASEDKDPSSIHTSFMQSPTKRRSFFGRGEPRDMMMVLESPLARLKGRRLAGTPAEEKPVGSTARAGSTTTPPANLLTAPLQKTLLHGRPACPPAAKKRVPFSGAAEARELGALVSPLEFLKAKRRGVDGRCLWGPPAGGTDGPDNKLPGTPPPVAAKLLWPRRRSYRTRSRSSRLSSEVFAAADSSGMQDSGRCQASGLPAKRRAEHDLCRQCSSKRARR